MAEHQCLSVVKLIAACRISSGKTVSVQMGLPMSRTLQRRSATTGPPTETTATECPPKFLRVEIERFGLASCLALLGLVAFASVVGGAEPASDWQSRAEQHRERAHLAPPEGYPSGGREDAFAEQSFASDFATRREAFLDHCVARPAGGAWGQMILAERRLPIWEGSIYGNLLHIDRRQDCADFTMQSVLRLLYQYSDSGAFSDELLDHAKQCVLDFKYWPDEPGSDSMCSWSENHHILFASAGYLAGQRYPDRVFTNSGWTGREQMQRHRPRVLRWLDLRFRTGFSEWLSNVYYDEDLAALANLVDFCADKEIARRATMVLDLMLADLACNSFRGCFASTHGRSYEGHKKSAHHEATTTVSKLCFGLGRFRGASMSATCLALSPNYRMPQVLYEIANDQTARGMVNRQRMGIRLDEAARWGLGFDNVEDGMVWLSLEAYSHSQTLPLFVEMLDEFNWWDNAFFEQFKQQQTMIREAQRMGGLAALAKRYEKDLTRNMREEVNIYTYRTTDYMLSTAQDYRAGYGGDQQAIWQATLGRTRFVSRRIRWSVPRRRRMIGPAAARFLERPRSRTSRSSSTMSPSNRGSM